MQLILPYDHILAYITSVTPRVGGLKVMCTKRSKYPATYHARSARYGIWFKKKMLGV